MATTRSPASSARAKPQHTLPAPETPQSSCQAHPGYTRDEEIPTPLLRLPLRVRIYFPPCYDERSEQRYPVLYLFHGRYASLEQWQRLGLAESMERLIAAGEIAPFLVVMPEDRYVGQADEKRFPQAIAKVLVPFVDETYRTLAKREYRAVGGVSRGAGWAVHLVFTHWELFSKAGAHSPALFYEDAPHLETWIAAIPQDARPSLFIDVGERDVAEILDSARTLVKAANTYQLDHEWRFFFGYHSEEYWRRHLELYLRWYAQGW